jgi:hypothetical protein
MYIIHEAYREVAIEGVPERPLFDRCERGLDYIGI